MEAMRGAGERGRKKSKFGGYWDDKLLVGLRISGNTLDVIGHDVIAVLPFER